MSTFTDKLQAILKQRNTTFATVSKETGISKNSLTYWKKNGNLPSAQVLSILAAHFDVPMDYLISDDATELPAVSKLDTETELKRHALISRVKSMTPEDLIKLDNILDYVLSNRDGK